MASKSDIVIGMQTLLESERQRADEFEKKFSKALETVESMRLKLDETERRVLQLQEAERRVLQFQDYAFFCLIHIIIVANMYTVDKIFAASKYKLCHMSQTTNISNHIEIILD